MSNNPDAIPLVRGADGGRWYAVPFRIVPARGQLPENAVEPSSKQSCDVLHDDDARSNLANDARVLKKKSASLPIKAGSSACDADVLARKTSADDVDGVEIVGANGVDVVESSGMRPTPFKNAPAEWINLHLPRRHSTMDCSLKPELKPAHTGEKRTDARDPAHGGDDGGGHRGASLPQAMKPGRAERAKNSTPRIANDGREARRDMVKPSGISRVCLAPDERSSPFVFKPAWLAMSGSKAR